MRLAENKRTSVKAAIKRASARARADMNRLDRDYLEALDRLYRDAAERIKSVIQDFAGGQGLLRLEVLQRLQVQIDLRLRDLADRRNQMLDRGLRAAARLGVEPFSAAPEVSGLLSGLSDEAVRFVKNFIDKDGLQLSDRLWRLDRGAIDGVRRAVESAIIEGHSASQAANEFLAAGRPVPAGITGKINAANAGAVGASAASALLISDDNPRVHALRLFRTELNRAHGEAYRAAAFKHPDVVGTRFLLSPRHPEPDICDMHARVNRYGLGPGVYPKGKSPWPAHPNTLSYEEVVFADEITEEDRAGKTDRITWLKQQRPAIQEAVLGSRKKRAALVRGILRESEIGTPWRVLKKRYTRRGIDVDALVVSDIEPARPSSQTVPTTGKTAPQAPVSAALKVMAHKTESQRALQAIDSVHGDGNLPVIPIKSSPHNANYLGAYYYRKFTGEPSHISIRAGGDHKELTLLHEVGHFIDHKAAPGKGFSSTYHDLFRGWRNAVDNTAEMQHLRALLQGPSTLKLADGTVHYVDKAYVKYLLSYEEAWARSYAQWITARAGDAVIEEQLQEILANQESALISYPTQWDPEGFSKVAEEIENIMRKMKWL